MNVREQVEDSVSKMKERFLFSRLRILSMDVSWEIINAMPRELLVQAASGLRGQINGQ